MHDVVARDVLQRALRTKGKRSQRRSGVAQVVRGIGTHSDEVVDWWERPTRSSAFVTMSATTRVTAQHISAATPATRPLPFPAATVLALADLEA